LADPFHNSFHTTSEINSFMDGLIAKSNGLATSITVGQTYQGKTIRGVKITTPVGHTYQGKTIRGVKITTPGGANKRSFIMHAGIHAREWITVSTAAYLMDQLITQSSSSPDLKLLVDTFEVIIIPVLNVDGYDYTRQNRMWRKNLQPNPDSSCIGIDLNRNWGYKWGSSGTDPCAVNYQGSSAFNTLETKAVSKLLSKNNNTIAYIDLHSYSQLWMHPYGYTCSAPPDNDKLSEMGRIATGAMVKAGGPQFKYGTFCNIIYPASGSSIDWAYAVPKIKYPFAVELKDTGNYGFIMPASAIIPQGREFTAAVV
ncbi:carboxypeptidase A2, pancreatic, isoform CRA_b, partial [Conidiobolus coronatus NRRL 28638]